jgi:hypothetical protein
MIVENSMARIREVLYSSNDDKRAALIALAKEDANNLAALIEFAKDNQLPRDDRNRAVEALGELAENHDDALEALCWVAQNEQDNDVRLMAIFALELRAETHEDACNALITAAEKDCFAPIRERAVISLKPLAKTNANARATLITVAKNDGDIDVRKRAIEGLAPLAAEHEDARKALIDIAQWKEKLRNDTWSSWSIKGLRVSAIAGLIPLAEKMSEEDCLALDEASADLIRDINQAIRFNTELSGIVSYFSQLAPRYGDACKGLIKIAQNDPNVHLRNEAAAALKSLETQETQTTIGSLAGQKQLLEQQQR